MFAHSKSDSQVVLFDDLRYGISYEGPAYFYQSTKS